MINSTAIDFSFIDTFTCKTIGIMDISYYNPLHIITEPIIQVLVPGYDEAVQLNYYKGGVTILNSSNLAIKKVLDPEDYIDLPDGAYTVKMSVCPHDQFYRERTFYRTCKLDCLYDSALLKLDFSKCDSCFSPAKLARLKLAKIYIRGVISNTNNCNIKKANELYSTATKILNDIIKCDNCE